ncbi:MAG: sigma 54-interacting transcriptional regulator [Deltaproteobacteria bacterium]|nr:sigma 54-interacting transcriptional regulator [Deltaproteobacteria bacterium]
MPKQKRYKTQYPGVYYINGRDLEKGTKEKVYYTLFRKDGKLVEEKAGRQFQDKMTPSRAKRIRDQKIAGELPLNRDQKKSGASHGFVDKSIRKVDEAQRFEIYRESKIYPGQLHKILNAIFRVSTDSLSICDRKGNIIACNEATSTITGLEISEFVGKNVRDLVENGILDKSVTQAVLAAERQVNTMIVVKPTEKSILSTGTPVFDENGNIDMIIINDRDMTQLNNLKAKLDETRLVTEKYKDTLAELSMANLNKKLIVAKSEKIRQVLKTGHKFAKLGVSNMLLLGESGTGKNLLAEFIHNNGIRKKKPFIEISCAAIPENLLEAELFGYEKGAFTGADPRGKVGLFELAHEGTLFLDEIGDIPLPVQVKLLKYWDNQEIYHIGGIKPIKVDCIIIGATNKDLKKLVNQGKFREDLFYRLNSVNLRIPPLRERYEDIPKLAHHFLDMYNQTYGFKKYFSPQALKVLLSYQFSGNIRELKNIINSAVLMSEKDVLEKSIVNAILDLKLEKTTFPVGHGKDTQSLKNQLLSVEKTILADALSRYQSTREIASHLNLSQSSVVRKLKHHGIMLK